MKQNPFAALLWLLVLTAAVTEAEQVKSAPAASTGHSLDKGSRAAEAELGRRLFFDVELSVNGTLSCASCHVPEMGFSHHELQTAVGIAGHGVGRNTPGLLNVAFRPRLFWDGRADSLEQQAWMPILSAREMGNRTEQQVLARLMPVYGAAFQQAFGQPMDARLLARALAAFQRTLVALDSPYDRWRQLGEPMPDSALRGWKLFTGKARCARCHHPEQGWFSDNQFHNTGSSYLPNDPLSIDGIRLESAALVDVGDRVNMSRKPDKGRGAITGAPIDMGKFLTPSLRNVALTPPYLHHGRLPSLAAVVAFYNQGGGPDPARDSQLAPLGLTRQEQQDLVTFLLTLTGSGVDDLVQQVRTNNP